jgi:hypothetical protein
MTSGPQITQPVAAKRPIIGIFGQFKLLGASFVKFDGGTVMAIRVVSSNRAYVARKIKSLTSGRLSPGKSRPSFCCLGTGALPFPGNRLPDIAFLNNLALGLSRWHRSNVIIPDEPSPFTAPGPAASAINQDNRYRPLADKWLTDNCQISGETDGYRVS